MIPNKDFCPYLLALVALKSFFMNKQKYNAITQKNIKESKQAIYSRRNWNQIKQNK